MARTRWPSADKPLGEGSAAMAKPTATATARPIHVLADVFTGVSAGFGSLFVTGGIGLFLAHSSLLGLHSDQGHPHAERMSAGFNQWVRFQRSNCIDAFILHRFENGFLLCI